MRMLSIIHIYFQHLLTICPPCNFKPPKISNFSTTMMYLRQYMGHFYHSTANSPHPMYGWEYETSWGLKYLIVWVSHPLFELFLHYCQIYIPHLLADPYYQIFSVLTDKLNCRTEGEILNRILVYMMLGPCSRICTSSTKPSS